MRPAAAVLSLGLLWPGLVSPGAAAQGILTAVRGERWAEAESLARAHPDPVAYKLVQYLRLLTAGAGLAPELSVFIAQNADWPQQALLARRLQEALAASGRDQSPASCQNRPALPAAQLLRCADAASRAGRVADAVLDARAGWIKGVEPAAEAAFLLVWGRILTPDDHWRRFERLAWTDTGQPGSPAAQQARRLEPARRNAAYARLALRRDDPAAAALVTPALLRGDPGLVLDFAKFHRRAGQDAAAVAVWARDGMAAEIAAPADRRPAFWDERNLLARRMVRGGMPDAAYALVSGHRQANEAAIDAEFLAGWIALRRLDQPATATRHFETLASLSRAAITSSRAQYWIGRAAPDPAAARVAYTKAAAWPTTYYGQLASQALGEDDAALAARLRAVRDPAWTAEHAAVFAAQELARAAALLVAWGEPRRARMFLQRLDEAAPADADRAMAARLSLGLGLPDQAVAIARRAGRDGLVLPDSGWPMPVDPPTGGIEAAVSLALIRQESSFDIQAASPVGARGLMQLMPATAAGVARQLNEAMNLPALTSDAAYNMRLGTAYLQSLMERFGAALPLALAGYNAGPSRVQDWIVGNGDPRAGAVDMIDWIEQIPFNETRNYVQRVIESVVIYRARRGDPEPHPLTRWTK